jgi:ZIP family zinc transporter
MALLTIALIIGAIASTILGGMLALRFSRYAHYFNAFAAGLLLGAAAFEIIPHATEITGDVSIVMTAVVAGFLAYYILQRFTIIHACQHTGSHHEDAGVEGHTHHIGVIGAAGLTAHRFLDGAIIGLAVALDPTLGLAVGLAIVAHGFGDGVSTVMVMLKHKNTRSRTWRMLALSAVAPLVGAIVALNVSLPQSALAGTLGFFAGFFLYMSTSDLLPEAHHKDHSYRVLFATLLGVLILFLMSMTHAH